MKPVFTIPAIAALFLTACVPAPIRAPAPLPAPADPIVTPPPPSAPGDVPGPTAAPDPSAMASLCRSAAAQRLNRASNTISVSPAEKTALGFVVFGETFAPVVSVECSFGADGQLRAVRTG